MTSGAVCQAFSIVHVFSETPASAEKCPLPSLLPKLAVFMLGLCAHLFLGVLVKAG